MNKDSIFESYIKENKNDIIVYVIVLIIVSIVLFIIGKITNFYYILFLDIFLFSGVLSRVNARKNIKQIEKFIYDNKFDKKIGKIEYWNDGSYFLTENCIILYENNQVNIILYSEIKNMYYENKITLNRISHVDRYLYIVLINDKKYKFLVHSTLLVNEKTEDIGMYLQTKNDNIKLIKNN